MYGHLICLTGFSGLSGSKRAKVLNMAWLYMQGLHGVPKIPGIDSIRFNNASICLNVL